MPADKGTEVMMSPTLSYPLPPTYRLQESTEEKYLPYLFIPWEIEFVAKSWCTDKVGHI